MGVTSTISPLNILSRGNTSTPATSHPHPHTTPTSVTKHAANGNKRPIYIYPTGKLIIDLFA